MNRKRKVWIALIAVVLFAANLLLSRSFRDTLQRRKAIQSAQAESKQIEEKIASLKKKLAQLKSHPAAYEQLVRRELGYLRPGEREVRFLRMCDRGINITQISRALGLSREHVSRTVRPRVLALVARRFLAWANDDHLDQVKDFVEQRSNGAESPAALTNS